MFTLQCVCCNLFLLFSAKEEEGQAADEGDRRGDGDDVRHSERQRVGLRHDGGGAFLPAHPQPLQPAGHQSAGLVRTFRKI